MIDLRSWPVSAPAVHVVAPGQVHRPERSADMEGLVVLFGGNVLSGPARASHAELFLGSGQPPVHSLEADRMAEAWQLVELMGTRTRGGGLPPRPMWSTPPPRHPAAEMRSNGPGSSMPADRPCWRTLHPVRRFLELLNTTF